MGIKEIKEELKSMFKEYLVNNDKWITIHPHGEDSDDYRRLKLEDGETPKEAIERTYGKKDNISKDYKENTSHYGKKEHQEEIISLYEGLKNPNKSETRKKEDREFLEYHLKELNKYSDTSGIHLSDEETKRENKIKEIKKELSKKQSDKEEKKEEQRKSYAMQKELDEKYKEINKKWQNGEISYSEVKKFNEWFEDAKKQIKEQFDKEENERIAKMREGMSDEEKEFYRIKQSDKQEKQDTFYDDDMEETYTQHYVDSIKKDFDDFMKSQKEKKEEKKGSSIDEYLTHKSDKGFLYKSVGVSTYSKDGKSAEVEETSDGHYRAVYKTGNTTKDIKYYTTKAGMERGVKKHLIDDTIADAKPIEKTNLQEKEQTYKDVLKRYNDNHSKKWKSGISTQEYYAAAREAEKAKKELTKARREYAESIMANFEKSDNTYYEDKQNARRERYEDLSGRAQKSSDIYAKRGTEMFDVIPFGQPIHGQRDRNYRDNAWGKFEKSWKEQEKADYFANKAASVGKAGISADDSNAIAKLAEKYKSGRITSAEKRRIIDRVIDIHKNRQMAQDTSRPTDFSDLGFQVERNTDINRLQLKFDGKPDENTRSILKHNGFRWSPREGAWQRQLGANSEGSLDRVVEKLKGINNSLLTGLDEILSNSDISEQDYQLFNCINNLLIPKVNNNKEQTMALLEDLKKLITKVENDKGDDDMEIKNEKVDKRKLIDEVAGMMNEAGCSQEIIRTAVEKMEKIGYNDSEKSADNKKVKNEEEDEKEIKNCGKKAKNEDDEDEVEEVKEEVKEDVDNKCKNSKYFDVLTNIYNSSAKAQKSETQYVSRADREQAAIDYFSK